MAYCLFQNIRSNVERNEFTLAKKQKYYTLTQGAEFKKGWTSKQAVTHVEIQMLVDTWGQSRRDTVGPELKEAPKGRLTSLH